MANHVYDFSDSAHLSFIMHAGELRPNANRVSAFPLHFLWATSNDKASKTAMAFTAAAEQAFAEGAMRRVRFTLDAGAFERWPGILAKVPTWEAHHTRHLEERAYSYGEDPFTWRCRLTPFPLADVVAVHTQSCYSPRRRWRSAREARHDNHPRGRGRLAHTVRRHRHAVACHGL